MKDEAVRQKKKDRNIEKSKRKKVKNEDENQRR